MRADRWLLALCALVFAQASVGAERIVSLAPNLTELAFAAGAGDRVVATVEYSDFPQAARDLPRVGDAFRVDFERILALRPDAVLAWEPGTPHATVQRLQSLHLPVTTIRTEKLADISLAVREIGRIAGTQAVAAPVAEKFDREIEQLRTEFGGQPLLTVFLQINDRPLFTINGTQIMSEVVALCGGVNVFGKLNELAPQIGVEAVIAANPDVIISTGDAHSDAFTQWRRWKQIRAVRAGNLYVLSPDNLARSTTRLAEGSREMCRTLQTARNRLRPPN